MKKQKTKEAEGLTEAVLALETELGVKPQSPPLYLSHQHLSSDFS